MKVPAGLTSVLARLAKDQSGHAVQMAIAIALFAVIAAFGLFSLGDSITDFFVALSNPFNWAFR